MKKYIKSSSDFIYQIVFPNDWEASRAENILNQQSIWYDWGDWDRMLLHEDGLQLLYDTVIDFEEI